MSGVNPLTRKSKIILILTIIPVLIAVALLTYLFLFRTEETASVSAVGPALIVEVEVITKREGIEISGNIEPANSVDLAFPIAGYIDAVFVSEGDVVRADEVVAILEDSQQRYNLAEVDVEIDAEVISGTRRNLDLLSLKRDMTETELEDTRLSSTIAGVVSGVYLDVGDFVTDQKSGDDKDVVVRVIDRSFMTATVEVDELDAPYLSLGQLVEFQFDAYPDIEVRGVVSTIPLEARVTPQGIAVLDTEVTIDDPPEEILPFFTFAGEIFLSGDEDILLIPSDAVMERGERSIAFVVLPSEYADAAMAERRDAAGGEGSGGGTGPGGGVPGGGSFGDLELPEGYSVVPTPISVKEYGSSSVQVISGLKAGDKVLVLPAVGESNSLAEEESGSTNFLELLGLPPGGPGSSGGPGSGGGR